MEGRGSSMDSASFVLASVKIAFHRVVYFCLVSGYA
jgi:hypothetical protein